jgi:MinD-like ATPase involved in chromosome partitioning or flagellar assembly
MTHTDAQRTRADVAAQAAAEPATTAIIDVRPDAVIIDVRPDAVIIDGQRIEAAGQDPHVVAVEWLAVNRANRTGQPITVYAREDGQVWHFVVKPGGQVEDPRPLPQAGDGRHLRVDEPETTSWPAAPQHPASERQAASPTTPQSRASSPARPDPAIDEEEHWPGDRSSLAPAPTSPGRLNLGELAPRRAPQTQSRWRRLLRMGPSPAEIAQQQRMERLQQPLHGHTFIAASMQIKGGDGKTTSALLTAQAIAESTGHHVVVVSADPANGNLLERAVDFRSDDELMRFPTAIDLYEAEMAAREQGRIGLTDAYEISRYLALAGRLRVLGAKQIIHDDEDDDTGLTAEQVKVITECLSRVSDVIIFDCGTDMTTSAAKTVLRLAHALILVANPSWDTLRKGEQSLDLIEYRRPEILRRSTIGLIHTAPADKEPTTFNLSESLARLAARVASITDIPYDPWIRGGTAILWDRLQPKTRDAALDLAGHCADVWSQLEPSPPTAGQLSRSARRRG